jgi:Fe-S oxidoreductase
MAKVKIEVMAARAERFGIKWRDSLIAELPRYAPYVSRLPGLGNSRNKIETLRWISERYFGLSRKRDLPRWSSRPFRDGEAPAGAPTTRRGEVLLFPDTFNRYFEPENLRAAARVLARAGYRAVAPSVSGRPLCCGRPWLTAGNVAKARQEATRTMQALDGHAPIVGLEPSCIMTLRDEFRSLRPGVEAERFGKRAMLISEFLMREAPDLPLRPLHGAALVHGHCHQKAFGAFPDALQTLGLIPGLSVKPIASSCCGMAGSFGYQVETEAISRAMAEAALIPAVMAADDLDIVVADGTSCRHQIRDLTGRGAVHSVRVLERALTAA